MTEPARTPFEDAVQAGSVKWDDVDFLRRLAGMLAKYTTSVSEPEDALPLYDLADRIAAKLPPREET